uniref:Uncharacterized protein n=1 Tax=Clastoptera arizonana TaxID=38151 RepID=A0A1B6C2X6_9HEMI
MSRYLLKLSSVPMPKLLKVPSSINFKSTIQFVNKDVPKPDVYGGKWLDVKPCLDSDRILDLRRQTILKQGYERNVRIACEIIRGQVEVKEKTFTVRNLKIPEETGVWTKFTKSVNEFMKGYF